MEINAMLTKGLTLCAAIVVGDFDCDGKVNVADHVKLSDIVMSKF